MEEKVNFLNEEVVFKKNIIEYYKRLWWRLLLCRFIKFIKFGFIS